MIPQFCLVIWRQRKKIFQVPSVKHCYIVLAAVTTFSVTAPALETAFLLPSPKDLNGPNSVRFLQDIEYLAASQNI